MSESNESDIAQAVDTPSVSAADTQPSVVPEIMASLEAEEAGEAGPVQDVAPVVQMLAENEPAVEQAEDAATATAQTAPVEAQPAARRPTVPNWPFLVYLAVWTGLAGAAGWLLTQTPPGEAVYGSQLYASMVLAGLVLTMLGPAVIAAVWLAALVRSRGVSHAGLFTSALLKGALATFCGVALWWTMLVVVDTLRLGRPL